MNIKETEASLKALTYTSVNALEQAIDLINQYSDKVGLPPAYFSELVSLLGSAKGVAAMAMKRLNDGEFSK